MRIVHISDLHAGRQYTPTSDPESHWMWAFPGFQGMIGHSLNALGAVEAFVERMRSEDPSTLVALTGDLTAHGHSSEFAVAAAFMGDADGLPFDQSALSEPLWQDRTIPGNHDSWGWSKSSIPHWPRCVTGACRPERQACTGQMPAVGDLIPIADDWTLRFLRLDTDRDVNDPPIDIIRRATAVGAFLQDIEELEQLLPKRQKREVRVLLLHHCAETGTDSIGPARVEKWLGVRPSSVERLRKLVSDHHIDALLCGHLHTVLLKRRFRDLPVVYARCGTTAQQSPAHVAEPLLRSLREAGVQPTADLLERFFKQQTLTLLTHDLIPDGDHLLWTPKTWVLDADAMAFKEDTVL